MKVLCKKSFRKFKKSNWYIVDLPENTYFDSGRLDSYFIRKSINYGHRFILDNWKNKFVHPKFSDYFYSQQELRKKKLRKINLI